MLSAARLTADRLVLLLAEGPASPPRRRGVQCPRRAGRWTSPHPDLVAATDLPAAPYPTLVSVGYTAAGDEWLINLEQAGCIAVTGDTERSHDLARFPSPSSPTTRGPIN